MLKALTGAALAAALAATTVAPLAAEGYGEPNLVDAVIAKSGAEGFDQNSADFDLLREALVAAGLVDAVASADALTVFAPTDGAFINLAQDLGYEGSDEAGAFGAIAAAVGYQSVEEPGLLDDVLLYHVAPGFVKSFNLADGPVETLLGATFTPEGTTLVDNDPNAVDAMVAAPFDQVYSNGVLHSIDQVLRPIDLPPVAEAPAPVDPKPMDPAPVDPKPEAPAPAELPSIVDIVLDVSGTEGFDKNRRDYDILREALVATGLVNAVVEAQDITVFAPNDRAFIRLARDLGFKGKNEAKVFAFLAEATGFVSAEEPGLLDDVLLYHVAPGGQTVKELQGEVTTLLDGATVEVKKRKVIDNDKDDRNAKIVKPRNIKASDGVIQTVNRVLRPIDL